MKKILLPLFALLCCFQNFAQPAKKSFIDVTHIDPKIKPGDNFYAWLNEKWIKTNPIPGTKSSWGSFDILQQKIREQLKTIFQTLNRGKYQPGTDEFVLNQFYRVALDSVTPEKLGITPLNAELDKIAAIGNLEALQAAVAENHLVALGTNVLFGEGNIADPVRNDEEIIYFNQAGMGLSEKGYYFDTDSSSVAIRKAYTQMLKEMLSLSGVAEAAAAEKADSIMALETRLAKASRSSEENRNIMRLLNYYTVEKMQKEFGSLNWALFLQQLGAKPNRIIVAQPEFFKNLDAELKNTSLEVWKDYLKAHTIVGASPYLSKAFVTSAFNFFNKTLSGQKEQKPRWERATNWTNLALGEMLGKIYVKQFFPPAAKKRIDDLIDNLVATYRERINGLEWMTAATKTKALLKLDSLRRKVGYPDKWLDYKGLQIGNNLYTNVRNAQIFNAKRAIARIGKPSDRKLWSLTPQTVNANYNPLNNEITFPAGILQFPFFDANADDAMNYGAIGMVIGHEISHGFDDQGSQFDASGKFSNWWTKEDKTAFTRKGEILAAQFDKYIVADSLHVNGRLTLGENIGDLGGLTAAFEAFKKTKQYKEGKKIDGYTPAQRFFMSLAQVWRINISPEADRQQSLTDPHAPGRFRVLGPLSNFTPFYEAFDLKPGDAMWRNPEDRLMIW